MTVPNNVQPGDEVTSAHTNQLLAVVRDLDAHNDVVSITRSGSQLVVTQRDGTVTRLDIPSGGGTTLPAYLQADEEVLHSRAGSLYWDPIREVPIAGAVGHVLTVTGENDDDYAWRAAPEGGGGGGDTSGLDQRISANAGDITELQTEVAVASRSIADANTQREQGDDIQSVTVSSASSYQSTLNSQLASPRPLILVIDTSISGSRGGAAYSYEAGDVLYFTPTSDAAEFLFNLGEDVDLAAYRTSTAQDTIDTGISDRVTTNTGNIATNSNLISSATRTLQSLVTEVDTLHPKIGRLVPITPWIRSNTARTLRFAWFPLAAVSTSDTLRMSIGGVAHTPRVTEGYSATDVSGIVLAVPVSAANSATITREANTTAGFVRVDLVMDRAQFHCYIPAEDAPATGGGGGSAWRAVDTAFDWQNAVDAGYKAVTLQSTDTELRLVHRWTATDNSYFFEQDHTVLLSRVPAAPTTLATLAAETIQDRVDGRVLKIGAGIRRTSTANRLEIAAWRDGIGPSSADNWQIKAIYAR